MRAKTKGISNRRGAITMAAGLLLMVALAACNTTPTQTPTPPPTLTPTEVPTLPPTAVPTLPPTAVPTLPPTAVPTLPPTEVPTQPPTLTATQPPTQVPTQAPSPTTAVSTATSAAAPAGAAALDGATLVDTRCSICHSTARIKSAHKTRDEWDQTVTRMIGKGAQLTDEEKAALIDYLAKTYGS